MGSVTGPATDPDTMTAPDTRVVKSWDVTQTTGTLTLSHTLQVDGPCYFRLRGTDGKRNAPGPYGAEVDASRTSHRRPRELEPLGRSLVLREPDLRRRPRPMRLARVS